MCKSHPEINNDVNVISSTTHTGLHSVTFYGPRKGLITLKVTYFLCRDKTRPCLLRRVERKPLRHNLSLCYELPARIIKCHQRPSGEGGACSLLPLSLGPASDPPPAGSAADEWMVIPEVFLLGHWGGVKAITERPLPSQSTLMQQRIEEGRGVVAVEGLKGVVKSARGVIQCFNICADTSRFY